MIEDFDIKRIVILCEDGQPSATASVEFMMQDPKPDIEALKVALTKWVQQLQGQTTLK